MKKIIIAVMMTLMILTGCSLLEDQDSTQNSHSGQVETQEDSVVTEETGEKKMPKNYEVEFISEMEDEIFLLVNEHRENNGEKPLKYSEKLHESARHKSNAMIQFDFFSHDNPHLNKDTLEYLMWDLYDVGFEIIGENIAVENGYGRSSAESVFKLWKTSPAHNKAMLDPEFTHMAVGIVYSPEAGDEHLNTETLSGTQHFGGN